MNILSLARWIAALLAASAVVFAFAVAMEGLSESAETGAPAEVSGSEGDEAETGEALEGEEGHSEEAEQLLGMNLESPWLVWAFVVVSFALAVAVLRQWKPAFALTVVVSGAAALLDAREVFLQFGVDDMIAVLAALIGLSHAAAAMLAVVALRRWPST